MNCLKQFILGLISLLIFSLILLPLHLYRLFVFLLPKGKKVFRLCSLSTSFFAGLGMKSPKMGNILIQAKLEGPAYLEKVKKSFTEKIELYPELKCYMESFLGYPCLKWEEDFSLDRHIFAEPSPLPDEESLQDLKSKLILADFAEKTSPWTVHLVECGEEFLLIFSIRHVLGDGYSFLQLLKDEPLARPFIPVTKWQAMFWIKAIFSLVPPGPQFPSSNRFHNSGKLFTAEAKKPLPLRILKEIKRSEKVRFVGVPAIAFSSAVGKHLERKREGEEELAGLALSSLAPVQVKGQKMVNEMSICASVVPLGENNLLAGLAKVNASIKEGESDMVLRYYTAILYGSLPLSVWKHIPAPEALLICSDFPGPEESIHLGGSYVKDLTFLGQFMGPKNGICLTSLSYNGMWKPCVLTWQGFCNSQTEAQAIADSITDNVENLYSQMVGCKNESEDGEVRLEVKV